MDHRQALREGVDADEEVLQGHVSRGKKVGTYYRLVRPAFRRGLSAAAPMLQDLGAGEALGSGVKALHSYDSLRKQVMDVDERGREHVSRIAKAIA